MNFKNCFGEWRKVTPFYIKIPLFSLFSSEDGWPHLHLPFPDANLYQRHADISLQQIAFEIADERYCQIPGLF